MSATELRLKLIAIDEVTPIIKQFIQAYQNMVNQAALVVAKAFKVSDKKFQDSIDGSVEKTKLEAVDIAKIFDIPASRLQDIRKYLDETRTSSKDLDRDFRTLMNLGINASAALLSLPGGLTSGLIGTVFAGGATVVSWPDIEEAFNRINKLSQELHGEDYSSSEIAAAMGNAQKYVLEHSDRLEISFKNLKYWREEYQRLQEEWKNINRTGFAGAVNIEKSIAVNKIMSQMVDYLRSIPNAGEAVFTITAKVNDALEENGKTLNNLEESYRDGTELQKYFEVSMRNISYAVEDATKNIDQNFKELDIQPMVIEFDFGIPENALKEYKKKLSKIDFAKDLSGFTKTFDSQLKKVFGDDATTVINGFVDLFNKAGGDIETMFTGHWDDVVALSLDALNHAMGVTTGGSNQALQVMSGAFGQFQKLLDDSGNSMTTLWKDHWENVVDIGLNAQAAEAEPVSHFNLQTSNFSLPLWYNRAA